MFCNIVGGVSSPILSNLFLHVFDKVFHRPDGPAKWAKAKLVRYADDFVVLAFSALQISPGSACQKPTTSLAR